LGGNCGIVDSPPGQRYGFFYRPGKTESGMKAKTHHGGLMPAGLGLVALQ
jgi:hypothetical protein